MHLQICVYIERERETERETYAVRKSLLFPEGDISRDASSTKAKKKLKKTAIKEIKEPVTKLPRARISKWEGSGGSQKSTRYLGVYIHHPTTTAKISEHLSALRY